MADISKIKLPSGNEYDIKDATARSMISGGVSFNIVWTATDYASTSTPSAATLATIPAGVTVYYNSGSSTATGTMTASDDTVGKFYLVYSKTQTGSLDVFDEYATVGTTGNYSWEKIGDTQIDLSNVVTGVTLNQQTTNFVTGYASPTSDTFVKSVSAETNKNLVVTTVTGVQSSTTTASKATAATSQTTLKNTSTASSTNTDWLKGVSVANEILTIGAATPDTQTTTQFTFADVTVPIKDSSATTVATGGTATDGTGDAVVTGVTIGSSASALTGLGSPSTSAGLNTSTSLTVTKGS